MSAPGAVAVVGGGLAGLAAAIALAERGVPVELFEARRVLGGRASSFRDPASGELIDYCQHVSMGCCTALADFSKRAGIAELFRRFDVLHFIGPDGEPYDLAAQPGLPAPLHLAPALMTMRFFSLGERLGILRALWRLARVDPASDEAEMLMAVWLVRAKQPPSVVQQFWAIVLVSALGETLDRVTVAAARKIFVDGFMRSSAGYQILIPQVPLGELYGRRLVAKLAELGVQLHLQTPVEGVLGDAQRTTGLRVAGAERSFDHVVLAVPWRRVEGLLPQAMRSALPELARVANFESSPITGVHLWFHRPIMKAPHAILIRGVSDWLFSVGRGPAPQCECIDSHYYQVVISASRHLVGQPREALVAQIVEELQETFSEAKQARLLHWQVVTEKHAVFSPLPGVEAQRPSQQTAIDGLMLSGDWTATGWPATMESAVRSGYLAAEAVLAARGSPGKILVAEKRPSWLSRWLLGSG